MFGSDGRLRRRARPMFVGFAVIVAVTSCSTSDPAPQPPLSTSAPPPITIPAPIPVPPCTAGWGSVEAVAPAMGTAPVVAVRAGTDRCSDHVEFEVDGPAAGYSVRYVDVVVQDGSGAELTVPGGARLQVQLHHPAYNGQGQATLAGRVGDQLADVPGLPALRSLVFGGSFEGYATIGVGVRARLPFRVSSVAGPGERSRIVLEVAHRWS